MSKRIFISAAIIVVLAMLALLAYNNLEIYERKKYVPPSASSLYAAMEQWLEENGRPVRKEKGSDPEKITAIREKVAVVFGTACDWEKAQSLVPWIKRGNSLVICVNYNNEEDIDKNLYAFLSGYGINMEMISFSGDYRGEDIPDFYWRIRFYIEEDADIFVINDNAGNTRLAEIKLGDGTLTVTGTPAFMYYYNLGRETNARLAWELTGARADEAGVLFINDRNRNTSGYFFGRIMERGNLVPALVSALLVILLGFWSVIPLFGLVFEEKQKNARPIKERFAAEFNFLKKYRALDYYLKTYMRELKLTGDFKEIKNYDYRELINKLRRVHDETDNFKSGRSGRKTGSGKE